MRRNAVLFVLISLLSGFGGTAMTLVAGLWVLDLTGSVGLAALTGLCIYAPTFAAPWLGALVDRLPRRPLMIVTDLLLGLIMLTLPAVRSAGTAWWIYAVLIVRGISYVLIDAGETAILPSALPPNRLGDVNGWRSSAQEGMKLVAPLAGAALFAWRGPIPVVLIGAAMPLLTALCYALVRLNPPTPPGSEVRRAPAATADIGAAAAGPAHAGATEPQTAMAGPAQVSVAEAGPRVAGPGVAGPGVAGPEVAGPEVAGPDRRGRGEIREGIRALFGNPAVRLPVLVAGAAIGLSGLTNAAVLARIVHDLYLPATNLGFLTTAQGAGSIVSGLLVGRLLARSGPAVVAAAGSVVFAAGCLASCLPWFAAMIAGSVLAGLGLPWALIAGITAVQTGTPSHLLGRVSATSTTVMFGPVAVAIPLGAAAVQLGARTPLLLAAALAVAAAAIVPASVRRSASPSTLGSRSR